MYENESGGDPEKFDPENVDCRALGAIAADAIERGHNYVALEAACTVEEPNAGALLSSVCLWGGFGLRGEGEANL